MLKSLKAWLTKCRIHKIQGSVLVSTTPVEELSDSVFLYSKNVRRCVCGETFRDDGCAFRVNPLSEESAKKRLGL